MITRRGFLTGLFAGGATLAFNPHRVFFDMGRKLWVPEATSVTLGRIVREYITPRLADTVFTPSPLFQALMGRERLIDGVRVTPITDELSVVWEPPREVAIQLATDEEQTIIHIGDDSKVDTYPWAVRGLPRA